MALPVVAASLGGMVISSLVAFFSTKIPQILAALGISAVVYSGLNMFTDQLVSGVRSAVSGAGSIAYSGYSIDAVGLLGACGVFDAVNIVLSGYVSVGAIKSSKLVWQAMQK